MKTLFNIALIALSVLLYSFAHAGSHSVGIAYVPAESDVSYLIDEDFEGVGEPTDFTTDDTNGTVDYDYTTGPLEGSDSLYLEYSTGLVDVTISFTSQTEFYIAGLFEFLSLNTYDFINPSYRGSVRITTDGAICAEGYDGTRNCSANGTISTSTSIYIKARFVNGNPDGVVTVWTSLNGTSWTQQATSTDGQWDSAWSNVSIVSGSNNLNIKVDSLRISSDDFNY